MISKKIQAVPENYFHKAEEKYQGKIIEKIYSVNNYINEKRQLVSDQVIPAGEVSREVVTGQPIKKVCSVYLPYNYDPNDKEKKYDVIYFLHGVGGTRYEWLEGNGKVDDRYKICNIIDHLIEDGEIEPLIAVFPEGRSAHDWTDISFNADGTNMLGFYYFDYELRYDLIPFIESEYNTKANILDDSQEGIEYSRKHRAIAGLSMGGMQSLTLTFGGYRCDSSKFIKEEGNFGNGLTYSELAPGMEDLFDRVGAFSNAPTSTAGKILGERIKKKGYKVSLLYMTCGDKDDIAYPMGYQVAHTGLQEEAGELIENFPTDILKDCIHDFVVWNHGAYNFLRMLNDDNL